MQSAPEAPAASQKNKRSSNNHCKEPVRIEYRLLFSEIRQLQEERNLGKLHERKAGSRKKVGPFFR